jgi:hypothetical protein
MQQFKNTILPVLLATIWISGSEFFRNEVLTKTTLDFPLRTNGAGFSE